MSRSPTSAIARRPPLIVIYALAILVMVSAFVPFLAEAILHNDFSPQGDSLNWDRVAIGVHLVTDTFIGLAYVSISITLIVLARRAGRRMPFLWAFVAFGVFIIACGLTHFTAALTLWEPWYWFSGGIKYITMIASVGTAIAVPPLVPQVLGVVQSARVSEERRQQLEISNRELADTLAEAERVRDILQRELVTHQDNLEELAREVTVRRREAETAMRAREEFLSFAAHELKTPLTSIKATSQLLNRLQDGDATQPERVTRLRDQQWSQIVRLEQLVADLLDVSRIQSDRLTLYLEPFPLADLLHSVVERFSDEDHRTGQHDIRIRTSGDITVIWDRERMDQVLTNLLSNALKYSPDGGMVEVGATQREGIVRVWVRDEGIGMAEHEKDLVFQPFTRLRHSRGIAEGTGLGLYISRRIVERHHGAIRVESEPGAGSVFTLELPRNAELAPPSGNASSLTNS
jgi:signal transduction histidine kinase